MSAPTEQEIAAVSTAPRVTQDDIEANIVSEHYFMAADAIDDELNAITISHDGLNGIHPSLEYMTFCVLVLKNGFMVTGESACASPKNFDPEIGRRVARDNAVQKIWPLLGFLLKEKLHDKA